jgi:hypothetical protein
MTCETLRSSTHSLFIPEVKTPLNPQRREVRLPRAAEAASVLRPDHIGPVLRGTATDGVDYVCGQCGTVVADAVIEDQFFDIGVVCATCQTLVRFRDLPAGRSLPWRKTVMVNHGQYRLSDTVNTKEDIVMAGEDAIDRRMHEVGRVASSSDADRMDLGEELLRKMANDAKALLGASYEKLAASHARGKQSRTPPVNPHRLLELIDAAEAAAASFASDSPEIDAVATVELHTALSVFDRWRNDPCWGSIVASITNPTDYPHSVVLLIAASFLTDVGNGVELVFPTGQKRLSDLRIHTDARTTVSTEVKTPRALMRPERPITLDEAREIVASQISSAGTSAGGQLDPAHPGLLIVGGFGLRDADRTVLRAAARDELRRTARKRTHVIGIALVSVAAVVHGDPRGSGGTLGLTGAATTEIVLNHAFDGAISVDTSEQPWLKWLPDLEELGGQSPAHQRVGRNDPCWCGSGKKFKRCHGA